METPVNCPMNTYSAAYGASECTRCEDGKITTSVGSLSCVEASNVKCGPGQYSSNGYEPCSACAAGYYSSMSAATTCTACLAGTFSPTLGSGLCSTCVTGKVSEPGSLTCTPCHESQNQVPDRNREYCVTCRDGETAANGVCVPTTSTSSAVQGVLSNSGTPFYVLAIISVILGGLGSYLGQGKAADKNLVQQNLPKHIFQCSLSTAGMLSELILAYFVLLSGVPDLVAPGVVMLVSRLVIASVPGVSVAYGLMVSSAPLVDGETGQKSTRYFMNMSMIFENSKAYALLLVFATVEPLLLTFLPYYASDFSRVSFYPTMRFMQLVLVAKFAQLLVTFVAQVLILDFQKGSTDEGFLALLYLNIIFTGGTFIFKSTDMLLKRGSLVGANLSEESDAANLVATREQLQQSGADMENGDGLGLGTIYTDNPLHAGDDRLQSQSPAIAAPNPVARASDTDSLLVRSVGALKEEIAHLQGDVKSVGALKEEIAQLRRDMSRLQRNDGGEDSTLP